MSELPGAGVVFLVFDTLRCDFFELAASHDLSLPNFARLFRLAPYEIPMWCGSFPTVPMRTDLLTGRLCFLDRRWDRPQARERLWLKDLSLGGMRSTHVGDNYMLWESSLGGYFEEVFDEIDKLRGVGADPWTPVEPDDINMVGVGPCRSSALERQFRADLRNPDTPLGEEASRRLVTRAAEALENTGRQAGFLWIESFSCHEPWTLPSDGREVPGYPVYGRIGEDISREDAERQRGFYVRRLGELDRALGDFLDAFEGCGLDLVLLSDHGFYLGDFGLFGKPKDEPILPILGRLVCRTSRGDWGTAEGPRQPHELAGCFLEGIAPEGDAQRTWNQPWRLVGRNSPVSRYFQVLQEEGICVFERRGGAQRFLAWNDLDPAQPWEKAASSRRGLLAEARSFVRSTFGARTWVREFFG